nr:hypothetical protein [Tanacetum cinerariifolium]
MKGYIDNLERLGHLVTLGLGVSLILIGLRKEFDDELHAMLKLHEQTLPKTNAHALHAIRAGKVQKLNKHKKRNPKWLLGDNIIRRGKISSLMLPSPRFPLHLRGKISQRTQSVMSVLWELVVQGLRASRKLKPGALSLYVGNGQREAVEAIGIFYLCLPSRLEIVLNNYHYAPSITRGVIFVSRLYKDGFINHFENNTVQVSRNNMVYFSAIPRDVIFEIDLSNSYTNESSIYAVSNKRANLDLDFALFRGGEYMSQEFLDHLKDHGIITHRTPHTPQHNGVSERRNRTLLDMVRSMMSQITLLKSFWDYALETATRILNMVLTKNVEKTPYEALVKRDTLTKPDKLEPRSIKCIFIGYPKETIGYSFYYSPENKVLVARNAEFLENSLITQEASGSLEDLEIIQEEDTHPSIDTSLNHEEDDQEIDEPQSDINLIHRSTRTRHSPDRMCLYIDVEEHELGDLGEPVNYKDALLDPESEKWLNAINVEMKSKKDNETGYVFVLNGGAVDWKSAKQSIFATSSTEAEYTAAFDASKEAVWESLKVLDISVPKFTTFVKLLNMVT